MFRSALLLGPTEAKARFARTLRRMGITAVAALERDAEEPQQSELYDDCLRIDDIDDPDRAVAVAQGAQLEGVCALHPDDSLRVRFGTAAEKAGLVAVGGVPNGLERLRAPGGLRQLGAALGVRARGERLGPVKTLAEARELLRGLAFPVAIMGSDEESRADTSPLAELRLTTNDEELSDAFSELNEHGERSLWLQQGFDRPRLVRVPLVVGKDGDTVALVEQEFSVQQAARGLLVESPSPEVLQRFDGEALRMSMAETGRRAAAELGLRGLVSVEFLLDDKCEVWLSDVTGGWRAEHAVTEMVTGLDLVELHVMAVDSGALPAEESAVPASGHALQATLRCLQQAPVEGGAQTQGAAQTLERLWWPPAPQGRLRVENLVEVGAAIGRLGQPLARVTTYARTRHQALLGLDRSVAEMQLAPSTTTNGALIRRVLGHESFRAGQYDTGFVERLRAS